jgi:hypothetical protein
MLRPASNITGRTRRIRFLFVYPHRILYYPITEILEKSVHPLKRTLEEKWAKKDTSSLWTFARCPMGVQKKAVHRAYERRRLRNALWTALKSNGLNKVGQRLPGASPADAPLMDPLVGSLQLVATSDLPNASVEDLVRDCKYLLAVISKGALKESSNTSFGSSRTISFQSLY